MFEELKEYDFPFERVKNIKEQYGETKKEEKKEEVDEEAEPAVQEVTEEEAKEIEKGPKDSTEHLTKGARTIDLSSMEEGSTGESMLEAGDRMYLKGLKQANVHFHLMADNDLKQLNKKKRYQCLFDGGILSVNSCSFISEEFSMLFRDKAKVYCETGDFLIGLKPEQRIEFRKLILGKV